MIIREMSKTVRTAEGFRPIEIKSAMTHSAALESGLRRFLALQPGFIAPTVAYAGRNMPAGKDGIQYRNFLNP